MSKTLNLTGKDLGVRFFYQEGGEDFMVYRAQRELPFPYLRWNRVGALDWSDLVVAEIVNLPGPTPDTIFIVTEDVAAAAARLGRTDVVFPKKVIYDHPRKRTMGFEGLLYCDFGRY